MLQRFNLAMIILKRICHLLPCADSSERAILQVLLKLAFRGTSDKVISGSKSLFAAGINLRSKACPNVKCSPASLAEVDIVRLNRGLTYSNTIHIVIETQQYSVRILATCCNRRQHFANEALMLVLLL